MVLRRGSAAGYLYDSSVFPGSRGHGGLPNAKPVPHVISTTHGDLVEFPISLGSLLGKRMYFFGGGYMRFFPYWPISNRVRAVQHEGRSVVFYLHPREIDPAQPRLPMSAKRRFMTYVGLRTTEPKMRRLFDDFRFTTFAELLVEHTRKHPLRMAPVECNSHRGAEARRIAGRTGAPCLRARVPFRADREEQSSTPVG